MLLFFENSKQPLICTIPVEIRGLKMKEIFERREKTFFDNRRCNSSLKIGQSSSLVNDENTVNLFDLSKIKFAKQSKIQKEADKENIEIRERTEPAQHETAHFKRTSSKVDSENNLFLLSKIKKQNATPNQGKVQNVKKNFVKTYHSPSPMKSSNAYKTNKKIGRSVSKEREMLSNSKLNLNNCSKITTPGQKRPWVPF
jgi:hypothetical protein